MAKKKKKKQKPSTSNCEVLVIHHLISIKDIPAWGSGTMCGERAKSGSTDHTKVTCNKCAKYTNWTVSQYKDACSDSLYL
jgi:hypothetical protein